MKSLHRQLLGKQGEDIAASYLVRQGYHLIQRNFKARYGELDIIATHHQTLVIVEVKTRIDREFGLPEEAVTPRKVREVVKTAEYYKLLHPELPDLMRLDVIAIQLTGDRVSYFNHIQNVTG